MPKKLTTEQFIEEAIRVHSDRYDYSKTVYTKAHAQIVVTCPTHGDFHPKACNHIHNKSGCPTCSGNVTKTTDEAISAMKKIHGDRYDYSKINYVNATSKLTIICRQHGEFQQTYNAHVSNKNGCPLCKTSNYKDTVFNRYGVANVMHIEQTKLKQKATNAQKYGTEYAAKSSEVKQRIKQSKLEKYGTDKITHLPNIAAKREKTCIDRFGVSHPWASDKVRQDIASTLREKYNCDNYSHAHIDQHAIECLSSERWLRNEHITQKRSYTQISRELNVDLSTVANYAAKHGIETQRYNHSVGEQEIADYIASLGFDVVRGNRTVISPQELDMFVPAANVAIEFCGLYWHREQLRSRTYHYNKTKSCAEKNIQLITVFEDEWYEKRRCVESKIKRLLKVDTTTKIFARKCEIITPTNSEAAAFLNDNHIQGVGPGSIKYALKNKGAIVAVMIFIDEHNGNYVLSRYATSGSVPGGFTKLLAHFKRTHNWKKIKSFADLRFSDGDLYTKNGWTSESTIPPDYYWCKGNKRYHKFAFRHANLPNKLQVYDPSKSESENCYVNGYFKVYDCGKIRYVINNLSM